MMTGLMMRARGPCGMLNVVDAAKNIVGDSGYVNPGKEAARVVRKKEPSKDYTEGLYGITVDSSKSRNGYRTSHTEK
jgi:hypothetical protein